VVSELESPWIDLLRQLDPLSPSMGVWKNSDEALAGNGDVDYFAPRSTWPAIVSSFRAWAGSHGFEYLPPCRHRPGALYLIAVHRERHRLMQLDVRESFVLAGSEILYSGDLDSLVDANGHGFSQLRPGAEATLKLLSKCIDRRGRVRQECPELESVSHGVGVDLAGARQMASLLRHGRTAADRLIVSIAAGHPDEAAARSLVRSSRIAAGLDPRTSGRLVAYRLRRRSCPTLAWILSHGQRLPPRLDPWIGDVRRVHHNAESWLDLEALEEPTGAADGAFIVIAGPDGVGKSTLREGLTEVLRRRYPVWSGRLSGPLSELRRSKRPEESRGAPAVSGSAVSKIRVLYLFVDAVLRWLMWTRSWLKRGGWVITERGWWDIAVYPTRYRVEQSGRLHRALGMMGPRPDLILVMEAAAEEVRTRKSELSEGEIRHQTELWRSVIPHRQPHVYLDAGLAPKVLLNRALEAIEQSCANGLDLTPPQ